MKKLLHWLLCHNVIIALLLFILAGWLFRHQIFTLPTPSEPEATAESSLAVTQKHQQLPVEAVPDSSVNVRPNLSVQEPVNTDLNSSLEINTDTNIQTAGSSDKETKSSVTEMPVSANNESVVSVDTATAEAETFPDSAKHNPEKMAVEQEYQFRPDSVVIEEPSAEIDLLQKARQAYWTDQLDKAESLYRAYIELNPDNPDGYGELGNLLSTVGSLAEASIMYQRAAELLLRQGRTEQAAKLREVLDSIEIIQNRKN